MESVKAVLFDFGDTLVDEDVFLLAADQAAIDVVLRHHGFPGPVSRYLPAYRAAISAAWRSFGHLPPEAKEGRVRREALGAFVAGLPATPTGDCIEHALASLVEAASRSECLFAGAREALQALRAEGLKLAVLSNGLAAYTWGSLQHHDLVGLFEFVYISEDVGLVKPDPAYFLSAARALEVPAAQVVMVGNRLYEDVYGAKQAGMRAIWMDRRKPIPFWEVTPDHVIHDVRAVPDALRAIDSATSPVSHPETEAEVARQTD